MKYLLLIFAFVIGACAKEDKVCEQHTLDYIHTQSEDLIANQASGDMTYRCGGEYNLISRTVEKHIIYVFTCPNSCN